MGTEVLTQIKCHHCGDDCPDLSVHDEERYFCCVGCKTVHNILHQHELNHYYSLSDEPVGTRPQLNSFEYLKNPDVASTILDYEDDDRAKVTWSIPNIHCASCIWLLEHIDRMDSGVVQSRVDFLSKKCSILYDKSQTDLYGIASILSNVGYTPSIQMDAAHKTEVQSDHSLLLRLGVAGFVFGNIMLLSFPEYLGLSVAGYMPIFSILSIVLIIPALFYSAQDYLKSAFRGVLHGRLNIDTPITLGMMALLFKSLYDILIIGAEGYLDSLSGFIFFLLIAKWFQRKSHDAIQFDRDYQSFFPLAILKETGGNYEYTRVQNIEEEDLIKVKSSEIIPCDGQLISDRAVINYSFVTGEERPKQVSRGDEVYAGGKVIGSSAEIRVARSVDQSYLTQLWNEAIDHLEPIGLLKLIDRIGHAFVYAVLVIAIASTVYWYPDLDMTINAVSSILIIACPCVIALSVPFIYGNMLRLLNKAGCYVRHTDVLFRMGEVDTVIFDKTGTITDLNSMIISYEGQDLSAQQKVMIRSVCAESTHPLSKAIYEYLSTTQTVDVDDYVDHIGMGVSGSIHGQSIRIGSASFIFDADEKAANHTQVMIEIGGAYLGRYIFQQKIRKDIPELINRLQRGHKILMLSGDNDADLRRMQELFPDSAELHFNQKPIDKLNKVKDLQSEGKKVLMIGDGLNDAGALKASDVGVVISDQSNQLSPACDIIIDNRQLAYFYRYLTYIKQAKYLLYGAFAFALLYNLIGLAFAFSGNLTPLVAAILMPVSSGSILIYALLSTRMMFGHTHDDENHYDG